MWLIVVFISDYVSGSDVGGASVGGAEVDGSVVGGTGVGDAIEDAYTYAAYDWTKLVAKLFFQYFKLKS